MQRRREHEREPAKAPFVARTQAVVVGVLAAAGAGMLALSLI